MLYMEPLPDDSPEIASLPVNSKIKLKEIKKSSALDRNDLGFLNSFCGNCCLWYSYIISERFSSGVSLDTEPLFKFVSLLVACCDTTVPGHVLNFLFCWCSRISLLTLS